MTNKRRGQDDQNQLGGGGKRSRCQKNLYLVLDDWKNGFSIHKIDADNSDSDDAGVAAVAGHLPEPPLLRLESPVGCVPHVDMLFSALGTKIFVFMNQRCALVYDTETAVLAVGPHAPDQMLCGFGVTVAAGEKLYALSHRSFDKQQPHSFQVMSWTPTAPDAMQHPTDGWSWKTLPAPQSTLTGRQRVTSYALHPDGCTIFMTTAYRDKPGHQLGTYSFNTKDSAWRWHGEWTLPFYGRGYFDSELDAWVGLQGDGYICSCQVASCSCSAAPIMQPDWQVTKEKLFCKDWDRHLDASLTHMGRSKFCLVESAVQEGVQEEDALGDHHGCVLHLTMFGLKYNHKAELQTTNQRSTRSFIVSRHKDYFSPVAFWM